MFQLSKNIKTEFLGLISYELFLFKSEQLFGTPFINLQQV